MLLKTLVLCSR